MASTTEESQFNSGQGQESSVRAERTGPQTSYSVCTFSFLLIVKKPRRAADQSPPPGA
jgi:hypothetical protein